MIDYYRDIITSQSWKVLGEFRKTYSFVLIGGWAVWLYTKALKSKDIDIVVDFPTLGSLKNNLELSKNDRLRKYETRIGSVSIDIYASQWSRPGIPAEDIIESALSREAIRVPPKEMLLITKQVALEARKGSSKGRKDFVDIVSLLLLPEFDWDSYHRLIKKYQPTLAATLAGYIKETTQMPEISLNPHQFARYKKSWLENLHQGPVH